MDDLSFYYQGYALSQDIDEQEFARVLDTLPDLTARREFMIGHMHAAIDAVAKSIKSYAEAHIDDQRLMAIAVWLGLSKATFRD